MKDCFGKAWKTAAEENGSILSGLLLSGLEFYLLPKWIS